MSNTPATSPRQEPDVVAELRNERFVEVEPQFAGELRRREDAAAALLLDAEHAVLHLALSAMEAAGVEAVDLDDEHARSRSARTCRGR